MLQLRRRPGGRLPWRRRHPAGWLPDAALKHHHAPGGLYERIFLGLELLWITVAAIALCRRNSVGSLGPWGHDDGLDLHLSVDKAPGFAVPDGARVTRN